MANTLTGLITTLYESLDTVSRENVGFIPAVRKDTGIERAKLNELVTFPIVPQNDLEAITPGAAPAASGSQVIGNDTLTISESYAYPILWNGEEQKGLGNNNKPMYNPILGDQFQQAFRTFSNTIDSQIAALSILSSNAYGTAAATPFGTANDLSDFAGARRILAENGAPKSNLQMVLGSAAAANIRGKQSGLFSINQAGSDDLLRRGMLGMVQGFDIHESAEVDSHTKGTGTSYVVNEGSTLAIGTTTVGIDTGSGTVLAGDVVTFAGDTNKYVVKTGTAAAGDIILAKPGLKQTLADGVAMTIGGTYTGNLVFDKNAIVLATRKPAAPEGGDSADDVMEVSDPITGITYEVRLYRQYRQIKIEICLAWGYKLVKPEHVGILLG